MVDDSESSSQSNNDSISMSSHSNKSIKSISSDMSHRTESTSGSDHEERRRQIVDLETSKSSSESSDDVSSFSSDVSKELETSQSSSESTDDTSTEKRARRLERRRLLVTCRCHRCLNPETGRGRSVTRRVFEKHNNVSTDESSVSEDSSNPSTSNSDSSDDTERDNSVGTKSLYPSTNITVLASVVMILSLGSSHNLNVKTMQSLFLLISCLLPEGHLLPSYKKATRLVMKESDMELKTYDMCGSCSKVMFRNKPLRFDPEQKEQYSDLRECPVCHTPRQLPSGEVTTKRYTHLGLIPQLKSLFWNPQWRQSTVLRRPEGQPTVMRSIQDSPEWISFLRNNPSFASSPTNLALCYCTDGINPFKNGTHTTWPQMFKVLNLPPHMASRTDLVLLTGVTHGPRKPKSLTPILELHYEELTQLWEGIRVEDPNQPGVYETLRAVLFCTSADYPGFSDINRQQGVGSNNGCMECHIQGRRHYGRMVYGGYRRYLPPDHPWRSDPSFGGTETRRAPVRKTQRWLSIASSKSDTHDGPMTKHPVHVTGVWGTSPLSKVRVSDQGDKFDLTSRSMKDPVHVMKGVTSHVMRIIKGYTPKKPKKPVRPGRREEETERAYNKRVESYNRKLRGYHVDLEHHEGLCEYITSLVPSPSHFVLAMDRFNSIMGRPGFVNGCPVQSHYSPTMHDCHVWWTSGICKLVMSPPVLSTPLYEVICGLCDILTTITSNEVNRDDLDSFYPEMIETLCKFEKVFPVTEHAIVVHLILEIYNGIRRVGPVYYHWMYVFERFVGRTARMVKDKGHPETNLMNVHSLRCSLDHVTRVHGDTLRNIVMSSNPRDIETALDVIPTPKSSLNPGPPRRVHFPSTTSKNKHLSEVQVQMVCDLLSDDHPDLPRFLEGSPSVDFHHRGVRIRGEPCSTLRGEGDRHRKTRYLPTSFRFLNLHSLSGEARG